MGTRALITIILAVVLAAILAAEPALAGQNPLREVYFGETHVHTSWSFDAYIFGNTLTGPAEAYKYGMGEPIKHPMGYTIQIAHPLDWMGVTDHSEYVGTVRLANDPGSAISKLPIAEKLKVRSQADIQRIFLWLGGTMANNQPIKELVDPQVAGTVWKENVAIADRFNKPGKFTAFAAYEWTSTPDNCNLHRNIFFKDSKKVPEAPFSSLDSQHPEDLWRWMDSQRQAGHELLAISHNANLSDGLMFPTEVDSRGRPIDAAWAEARRRNEKLSEIKQIKGQSETHPLLSPNDEFANFEVLNYLLMVTQNRPIQISGSYLRRALENGLAMQDSRNYNPYKVGFVGGSDSHDTGAPYRQKDFFGGHGVNDGGIKERMSGRIFSGLDLLQENPAGLTGVWAEENTREAIFDAMQRRETYGTSGPRHKLRFFGGWGFAGLKLLGRFASNQAWVQTGYEKGVPMGSDLTAPQAKAPSFIVWAVKDPDSGNLDRIQIVKGWTKNGQTFEKIYDVAWSGKRRINPHTGKLPPVGNTVNISTATYTNTIGATELKAVWTDPDFDPALEAFYYARMLEIPTPRWSTIQARQLGMVPPTSAITMGVESPVPLTVQERAWSSPIWYSPADELRQSAKQGLTVAALRQQGAVALDDSQLKDFLVGKTLTLRNNVTGDRYEILYGTTGRRLITRVNGKQPDPGQIGDVLHAGELGSPSRYEIKGGRLITTLGNTPYEAAVYKVGDKYYGARSNEFGFANYELVAVSQGASDAGVGGK
jgi:hypothetical protein